VLQHPLDLFQHNLRHDKLMFGKDLADDIGT
jgi:hypothetical protein